MWNAPTKRQLEKLPGIGVTELTPARDKKIHMHFFLGGCDWYVAEYDGDDTFFGFAVLNGDLYNAEWGYIPLSELKAIRIAPGFEVDRDLHWKPIPAGQIREIADFI
jgi:hypothetical protein